MRLPQRDQAPPSPANRLIIIPRDLSLSPPFSAPAPAFMLSVRVCMCERGESCVLFLLCLSPAQVHVCVPAPGAHSDPPKWPPACWGSNGWAHRARGTGGRVWSVVSPPPPREELGFGCPGHTWWSLQWLCWAGGGFGGPGWALTCYLFSAPDESDEDGLEQDEAEDVTAAAAGGYRLGPRERALSPNLDETGLGLLARFAVSALPSLPGAPPLSVVQLEAKQKARKKEERQNLMGECAGSEGKLRQE